MAFKNLIVAAPVMALLMSGTAHAALSVDQVWTDLQAQAKAAGMTLTVATETRDGDNLTLNGVIITDGPARITVSELSIELQEDGSVALFPEDIDIVAENGTEIEIAHKDLSLSLFEDEAGYGYGVGATNLKVDFKDDSSAEGETNTTDLAVDLTEFYGRYLNDKDARAFSLSADVLDYTVTMVDSAMGVDSTQNSRSETLEFSGGLTLPEGFDLADLHAPEAVVEALHQGLYVEAEMTSGPSVGTSDDRGTMFPLNMSYVGKPSTAKMSFNVEQLSLSSTAEGMSLTVNPPTAPQAMTTTFGPMEIGFAMPIVSPDEGGDYSLKLKLQDVVMDKNTWALIDPEAKLDQGPAEFDLDFGGKLKIDAITMAVDEEMVIPEPLTFNINALLVKVAGAALSGTGAFTFDNSMTEMGMPPMPLGTADMRLEGGNMLLDTLVSMGLLTEEDAGGARMMLMMFGKPADDGSDVLTSKIEAKAGGEISVNGQRIQ